ncbi:MAG: energy transducer TonB [Myxococcaceae bacterium]|nr:energy transducer TonB [Myxococcaceae bacterium]
MFEAFEVQTDPRAARRFAASTGMAVVVLAALAVLAIALAGNEVTRKLTEKVDVSFRPPPPPPPPKAEPPKPKPKPKPKPRAPPPPPKAVTPRPVAPPPVAPVAAPAPIVAPKEIPLQKAPEASADQAVAAISVAVGGTGDGSGTGAVGGVPGGTGAGIVRSKPINLPENAIAAVPREDNLTPEYPQEARAAGKEGIVILKVVIDEAGRITAAKVLRGEEPFVSAALKVVKTWRYTPATLDGVPVKHFKIVRVPFRLRS